MDQATFFVLMHAILGSLKCPLDDDNRDKLQSCLDEIQGDLSDPCVVDKQLVMDFDDQSQMLCGDVGIVVASGLSGVDLLERVLKAIQ